MTLNIVLMKCDTQHNITQHNGTVVMLMIIYAKCRYAECRGAISTILRPEKNNIKMEFSYSYQRATAFGQKPFGRQTFAQQT